MHWGGSIRPWCTYIRTYVYLSVTLGKDRHIHIGIYACVHGPWTLHALPLAMNGKRLLLRARDGEGWQERESATEYFRLVEGAFAAACTSNH